MVKKVQNFRNKNFDNKAKGKGNNMRGNNKRMDVVAKENVSQVKDELVLNNKKHFFNFDGDTNILNKFKEQPNSTHRKNIQRSSWNYDKIINEENDKKLKEFIYI